MRRLLAALALSGCFSGEPLQYGGYDGEVLLRVECTFAIGPEVPGPYEVALVWLGPDLQIRDVWDDELERAPGDLGTRVSILLRADRLETAYDSITGEVALGQLVVFSDSDDDGLWDAASEPIVGMDPDLVVTFTSAGASGPDVGELEPGYQQFYASDCETRGPRPVPPHWSCQFEPVDPDALPFVEFCPR